MTPISSLHVVHSFDNRQGGVVHAALSIAQFLCEAGHPAEVIASHGKHDELDYIQEAFPQVRIHGIKRKFPARYFNAPEMTEWLEREQRRFDLINMHSVWTGTTARAVRFCRRRGKQYVLIVQNSLDPFDLEKRARLKKLLGPVYVRRMLESCAGVICTTRLESERLVTYGAKPPKFIVPLPVVRWQGRAIGRAEFRAKFGIPTDALVVLFISRFDHKKGLQFLIPAVAALKKNHPNIWLLMAGAGDATFTKEIARLLDVHQMRSWTTAPGFISGEEKQGAFAASDVFALPSLNENFGIVVVEALRAGVPSIVSNQVFLYPELQNVGAAVICQPSIESFQACLRDLLEGKVNKDSMIKAGRELAEHYFSPEAATQKLVHVYQQVLTKDRGNGQP